MRLKKLTVLLIAILLVLPMIFAGCASSESGKTDGGQDQNTNTGGTSGDETGGESDDQSQDYGTVSIDGITAWVGFPASDFIPVFSEPDNADKEISYEYDRSLIELDAEKCTVRALKEGTATVKTTFGSSTGEFTVNCVAVDTSGTEFDTSKYATKIAARASAWSTKAKDGVTTAFIGDSFFDENDFWTTFSISYAGKSAMCLGISSATTFDWEMIAEDIFGNVAPKNIVMHIGTNNIYDDGKSAAETVSALQRLFTMLHGYYPETGLYYFGISLRTYDDAKIGYTREVNEQIQNWCDARGRITYIDTPSRLTADKLRDDGCHPLLESYSIFTDALAQTDIVIEDYYADTIPDIVRTSSQAVGTFPSSIAHGYETLTRNFILSGKLEISASATNGHIEFRFINFYDRFLLWNNASDGNFKTGYACRGTHTVNDNNYYTLASEPLVLEWKIAITDNDAYLYINGDLKIVYQCLTENACKPFMLSSENVTCRFYDMEAISLVTDPSEYKRALADMSDVLDTYGNATETAAQFV